MIPPGSVFDRVKSSWGSDPPQRISVSPPGGERGWFAPSTHISPGLTEFGENGPYLGRVFEI